MKILHASALHAPDILKLQKECFQAEAAIYQDWMIAPLLETAEAFEKALETHTMLIGAAGGMIVGSVRAEMIDGVCKISRLFVAPQFQGHGAGKLLLSAIEGAFPLANAYVLSVGHKSHKNIRFYEQQGYTKSSQFVMDRKVPLIRMEKLNRDKPNVN